jgi:hypothetical protein
MNYVSDEGGVALAQAAASQQICTYINMQSQTQHNHAMQQRGHATNALYTVLSTHPICSTPTLLFPSLSPDNNLTDVSAAHFLSALSLNPRFSTLSLDGNRVDYRRHQQLLEATARNKKEEERTIMQRLSEEMDRLIDDKSKLTSVDTLTHLTQLLLLRRQLCPLCCSLLRFLLVSPLCYLLPVPFSMRGMPPPPKLIV